jgi:hypothetical protein
MITIMFTRPKHWSLVSAVIKWISDSPVSHVAIGTDLHGVPIVLGADAQGIHPVTRTRFLAESEVVEEYATTKVDLEPGFKRAIEHMGEKYDFAGLLGFGLVKLAWRWLRVKVRNPWTSPRAMWCSEFVLHLDEQHLIAAWSKFQPEATDVEFLRRACEGSDDFRKLVPPV